MRRFRILAAVLAITLLLCGCKKEEVVVNEIEGITLGIDVARYQGTIDWEQVAESGVQFAMVRIGYRGMEDGEITEDVNARYNLQEAAKAGIPLGAYFFSTAISEEEAREEAAWCAALLAGYPITYPVVYDCENFNDPDSRQYAMTRGQRTNCAIAFLETIEEQGYEGMFYASKNDLQFENAWETGRIEQRYKVWVAQYPELPYPVTEQSSYAGVHQMWQYQTDGMVPGIDQPVDRNVAYFAYDGIRSRKALAEPEEVEPDLEAMMNFREVNDSVTAKDETNLRSIPSQTEDCEIVGTLKNGEILHRIAVCPSGWSKLLYQGQVVYAVTSYLTEDLNYDPNAIQAEVVEPAQTQSDIQTQFEPMNDRVTAKVEVNLRTMPSVEHPDCQVAASLKHGTVVTRTGINRDVGWSRVEYEGKTLYCVSSYLEAAE